MSKKLLFCLLIVCVAANPIAAWRLGSFLKSMKGAVEKVTDSVNSAGNTILTTIASPILPQCTTVKSMMGLTYSQMDGSDIEPSFDALTIDFCYGYVDKTYNLSTAASEIMTDAGLRNASQKIYLFVHGWMDSTNSLTFNDIKTALKITGNVNILALDSSKYLKWLYLSQSTYVAFIGEKLADVLIAFHKDGLDAKNMHIIGHSLGAQIAAYAGKTFQRATGTKIGRISGLDAAGPCFSELGNDYHLDSSDADFVDAIHSNSNLLGLSEAIGHVDFYPNGGEYQAGCISGCICSHLRAVAYFAESILNPESFAAVKCDGWDDFRDGKCDGGEVAYMGFGATPDHTGTFYLQTARTFMFGLKMNGTTYNVSL